MKFIGEPKRVLLQRNWHFKPFFATAGQRTT